MREPVFFCAAITGETRKQVSDRLYNEAMQVPGFQFTDIAGKRWSHQSYFEMLARTELMNGARDSYEQECAEQGYNIMLLSVSGHCCEACAKYEGQYFSIGPNKYGLPTKDDLEAAGVFHPNCTHSYSAVPDYIIEKEFGKQEKGSSPKSPSSPSGPTKPGNMQYLKYQTGLSDSRVAELKAIIQQDPEKGIDALAADLEKTITPELLENIKSKKTREQCVKEARAAVPPEVMKRTDDYVNNLPDGALDPLFKYTNKDAAGVNLALRKEKQTPEEIANITAFSTLLKNAPKYQGMCFRGCYFDDGKTAMNFVNDLMLNPEQMRGFTSLSPDFSSALYYATRKPAHVIIVIPESSHGVYWGPYSSQPRDHEVTLDYDFYLKGLAFCKKGDTLYVMAEEVQR